MRLKFTLEETEHYKINDAVSVQYDRDDLPQRNVMYPIDEADPMEEAVVVQTESVHHVCDPWHVHQCVAQNQHSDAFDEPVMLVLDLEGSGLRRDLRINYKYYTGTKCESTLYPRKLLFSYLVIQYSIDLLHHPSSKSGYGSRCWKSVYGGVT